MIITYECTVIPGETGCYLEDKVVVPSADFVQFDGDHSILATIGLEQPTTPDTLYVNHSSVVVPADPAENAPIFLTVREEYECDESAMGCKIIARETQEVNTNTDSSFTHEEVTFLDQPDKYLGDNGTLCRDEAIGCSEFSAGATISYFKDPVLTGNAVCEYKPATERDNETQQFGWFLSDVGTCSNDGSVLCTESSQCGTEEDTCENVGNVPCYDGFLQRGGEFGLWSNDSFQYEGYVGACEPQYNGCVELVDRADTENSSNENGEPYYVIFNDKLSDKISECTDKGVSLREGCVLFDRTDLPNKLYDTTQTYSNSEKKFDDRYGFVPPVTEGNRDANLLLKVDRDRVCAEWLACRNSLRHIGQDGKPVDLCYEYSACKGTVPGIECTDWVSPDEDTLGDETLTEDAYVTRDTSWYGREYVGLSLFDKFQIKDYTYLTFDSDPDSQFLVYEIPGYLFEESEDDRDIDFVDAGCVGTDQLPKKNWDRCGFDSNGRCYDTRCIYPIEGEFPDGIAVSANDSEEAIAIAEAQAISVVYGRDL